MREYPTHNVGPFSLPLSRWGYSCTFHYAHCTCWKIAHVEITCVVKCRGCKMHVWQILLFCKFHVLQITKLHRCKVVKVKSYKVTKLQRCKDAKVQRCKDEKMQSYKLQTRLRTQTHTHAWTDPQMDKWTSWAAVTAKKWMEFSIKGLDPPTHLPYSTKKNNQKTPKTHIKKIQSQLVFSPS